MPRPPRPQPEFDIKRVKGRRFWHIVWSERRRSKKVSTGKTDWAEARQFMRDWLADRDAIPSEAVTVTQVIDGYLADRNLAGLFAYQRLVEAAVPLNRHLGRLVPSEINLTSLTSYDKARKHVSPWTRRKEKQTLRAALRWGEKTGMIDRAPDVPLGPMPPPRDRVLDADERARLIAGAGSNHVRTFIVLGLYTGARKSAILGLTWDRVNFDTGLVTYVDPDRPETAKRRATVPMPEIVRQELLRAREAAETDYVIEWNVESVKDIKKAFARACQRAGLIRVTPHVLRHTCATMLAMKGRPLDEIADFLAADPATVHRHYRKHQPDYLKEAAKALDDSAPHGALISEHQLNPVGK